MKISKEGIVVIKEYGHLFNNTDENDIIELTTKYPKEE